MATIQHPTTGRTMHGPAQAIRESGFTPVTRLTDPNGDIVMHFQRGRTSVRLTVTPRGGYQIGAPGTWTAQVSVPGRREPQVFTTGGTLDGEAQALTALMARIAR